MEQRAGSATATISLSYLECMSCLTLSTARPTAELLLILPSFANSEAATGLNGRRCLMAVLVELDLRCKPFARTGSATVGVLKAVLGCSKLIPMVGESLVKRWGRMGDDDNAILSEVWPRALSGLYGPRALAIAGELGINALRSVDHTIGQPGARYCF